MLPVPTPPTVAVTATWTADCTRRKAKSCACSGTAGLMPAQTTTVAITTILSKLGTQLESVTGGDVTTGADLVGMFGDTIPTYYFQIVVGLYVIQITYILTILVNGIENGSDKLSEDYTVGVNMIRAGALYAGIALVIMLLFNFIAAQIMGPISAGL